MVFKYSFRVAKLDSVKGTQEKMRTEKGQKVNFLSYFQRFQSSNCGQKELKLNCFLSFQILIQISH